MLPIVAIIGRPNVGKSSLLNALAGKMISIVEPRPGVTRDRISAIVEADEKYFELVDTGGYGVIDDENLSSHIEKQIFQAIESAQLVLFVVDIREGITPLDLRIAELLRKYKIKVLPAANKADERHYYPQAGEFIRLGFGEPVCVSALNSLNKKHLMDTIVAALGELAATEKPEDAAMHIAIVGKRNAGKSTFINAVVGQERVIVSEVPGTTRDAVDVRFERNGKQYVIIDTAGVRKKNRIRDDVEFYSYVRATKSIRRADVSLLLIDAAVPVGDVDQKLAAYICENYKPCIIVINKWDLAKGYAGSSDYEEYLTKVMPGLRYAPIAFTTAKDAKNVDSVLDLAAELYKQARTEIPTPKLNRVIDIIKEEKTAVPKKAGALPKVFYATQIAANPVTIVLFVNRVDLFDENYQRYFVNRLRDILPIAEVPIRLLIRPRRNEKDSD